MIDVIDDDTLEYHYSDSKATSVGGFDWNLQVGWSLRVFLIASGLKLIVTVCVVHVARNPRTRAYQA